MNYKVKDETQKVFRTILNNCWALSSQDADNDTSSFLYYINDVINYIAAGEIDFTNLDNLQAIDPDANEEDYKMARSMYYNTKEMIDDLFAKMEENDNKANKKSII